MCELGWKSLGVLELTALLSIDEELWVPIVRETDALLVNGGDPLYLCYWMRQSSLADLFPQLGGEMVYVGLSAGSMVMTSSIGEDFVGWKSPTGGDRTLGLVDFAIFPHLDHPALPENTMTNAQRWAASMPVPSYAIDDHTAIQSVMAKSQWSPKAIGNAFNPREVCGRLVCRCRATHARSRRTIVTWISVSQGRHVSFGSVAHAPVASSPEEHLRMVFQAQPGSLRS